MVQLFLFYVSEIAMFFTWFALLDEVMTVSLHSWPEVSRP